MKKFINAKNFLSTIRNAGILLSGAAIAGTLEYGIISGTLAGIVLSVSVVSLATMELHKLNTEE